jgi:hypothetical protein
MYFGDQLLPLSVNIIEKNFAASAWPHSVILLW